MTDPVSGQAASQAVEQVAHQPEAVDEPEGAEPTRDFDESMESHQEGAENPQAAGGVEAPDQVERVESVDRVERIDATDTDDFIQKMLRDESEIDEMMQRALDGQAMDQQEMLQMQAVIYSYSQRVDLTTKIVDNATGAVEQVMNTQV